MRTVMEKRNRTKWLLVLLAIGAYLFTLPFAHAIDTITIATSVPGTSKTGNSITDIIQNFYSFAILISGILAVGVIVYGGVRYAVGRGNPSAESTAKSWITGALTGMLLLAAAWVILYTVNPAILSFQLPTITTLAVPSGGPTTAGCSGGSCENLADNGMTCKAASQQPGGVYSCSAAQGMVNTLQCMQQHGAPPFIVTEAMPPTVAHESTCHQTGCCVDTVVNSGNCSDVNAMISAAQACGATVANEYSNCGGQMYSTTEGNNLHIKSASGGGC